MTLYWYIPVILLDTSPLQQLLPCQGQGTGWVFLGFYPNYLENPT
jgi:hypothetical protein